MLKDLTLVHELSPSLDPFEKEKSTLLDKLDAQLTAVTNMVNCKPSGLTERQKWYYKIDGVMYFEIQLGNKSLVLGRENNVDLTHVLIGEDKNAPTVVQQIIEAYQNGELDKVILNHIS